jgi:hypothetical protein
MLKSWPSRQLFFIYVSMQNLLNPESRTFWSHRKVAGELGKVKKFDKAINLASKAEKAGRKVEKHPGSEKKAVLPIASVVPSIVNRKNT